MTRRSAVSKIVLSVLMALGVSQICFADPVTVGFENLESVCGVNYTNCDPQAAEAYYIDGIKFVNGIIQSSTYLPGSSFQSLFPFGSHYLNIAGANPTGPVTSQWNFVNPYSGGSARMVNTVQFLVLGKNGDVITGSRSGASAAAPELTEDQMLNGSELQPNVRDCKVAADCPGYLGGFTVMAYNGATPIDYVVVEPVYEGQAGYATYGQDFANIRVTVSSSFGFDRLVFTTTPTSSTRDGMTQAWGIIAIDQITFDKAVPEPGTFGLAAVAATALIAVRRRRMRANS